jgi:hypothetical protein
MKLVPAANVLFQSMDHLAEGFCGGALAPAAMPGHEGLVAHVRRDPEGRQAHKPLHDCLPSKRSHDTIPLYQGHVAVIEFGIVGIASRANEVFLYFWSAAVHSRSKLGGDPCPLWVKSRHVRRKKSCPLHPQ